MNNDYMNNLNASSKASFETFQKFNQLNVEVMEKLAALQFSLTSLNVESTVEQAKLLASGPTPDKLFEAESRLARTYGDKLIKITNETAEIISASREQLVAFAEKSIKTAKPATGTVKPAPKATKKKTAKKASKKAA